jgi:adenosine deaminase
MKIDLHRHLEGSHSATALCAVARTHGLKDPLFWDDARGAWRDVDAVAPALTMSGPTDDARVFYACIQKARAAYVRAEVIADLAERAFAEAAADATDGFEMRISLFSMTRTLLEHEGVAWRELAPATFAERARAMLLLVLDARARAQRSTGVPMLVRVGLSRTFESEAHYRALVPVLREHKAGITGLDVLGIVVGADKEPMPQALREIIETLRPDLPDLTIHAGEFEDHRSIERTLELSPQGIGHGVHAVGSDDVMARLAQEGVTLEVCPHSNHLLIPTALSTLTARHGVHPLKALQRHDVHCVLGSDDPTPMGTCFTDEWERARALDVDMDRLTADIARRWGQLPR